MVSELDTEQCVNKDARPPMRVDCEITHRLERGTKHFLYGCGDRNLSLVDVLSSVSTRMLDLQ